MGPISDYNRLLVDDQKYSQGPIFYNINLNPAFSPL